MKVTNGLATRDVPASLFDWREQRDAALERVEAKAERTRGGFTKEARHFVLDYLATHGPTSGEKLTAACKAAGIVPHDDRAFGAVYMGLVRAGLIVKVGTVRRERGHGTAGGNIWACTGRSNETV